MFTRRNLLACSCTLHYTNATRLHEKHEITRANGDGSCTISAFSSYHVASPASITFPFGRGLKSYDDRHLRDDIPLTCTRSPSYCRGTDDPCRGVSIIAFHSVDSASVNFRSTQVQRSSSPIKLHLTCRRTLSYGSSSHSTLTFFRRRLTQVCAWIAPGSGRGKILGTVLLCRERVTVDDDAEGYRK